MDVVWTPRTVKIGHITYVLSAISLVHVREHALVSSYLQHREPRVKNAWRNAFLGCLGLWTICVAIAVGDYANEYSKLQKEYGTVPPDWDYQASGTGELAGTGVALLGLVGFAVFVTWMMVLRPTTRYQPLHQLVINTAGVVALILHSPDARVLYQLRDQILYAIEHPPDREFWATFNNVVFGDQVNITGANNKGIVRNAWGMP